MNTDNFPKIILTTPGGARAEIYQHGAHVASWIPANGVERMFLSAKSAFQAGAPIRGENYFRADIAVGRVGPEQAPPRREFD